MYATHRIADVARDKAGCITMWHIFLKIDEFNKRMAVSDVNKRVGCPGLSGTSRGQPGDKAATVLL